MEVDLKEVLVLNVFDFDGTLFLTPVPESAKPDYLKVRGERWPYKGWWHRHESLLPPLKVFPGPALDDFHQRVGQPNTLTIMATGRRHHFSHIVNHIMEAAGVKPHRSYLNHTPFDTLDYKFSLIEDLLEELPKLQRIELWEDRPEHAYSFSTLSTYLRDHGRHGRRDVDVVVHQVHPEEHRVALCRDFPEARCWVASAVPTGHQPDRPLVMLPANPRTPFVANPVRRRSHAHGDEAVIQQVVACVSPPPA
mmetsp:Transcript_23712/g.40835  ORF Transcript_23712/g.40835 Transcript_23712/m.40835 type:complete len:251 (-) Transcript_23712:83-835(-)